MNCPMCDHNDSKPSWMGASVYRKTRYEYKECLDCRSMYVSPMPDSEALDQMYGEDYDQFISAEEAHSGAGGTARVLEELAKLKKGAFLDYGCGGGHLLKEAVRVGWMGYGVEFDRGMTEAIKGIGGAELVADLSQIPVEHVFDVVHLGDVIEHLADVNRQMPEILARLKHGGILIAQGPLEANFNLFLLGLRAKKLVRNTDSSMPPYHVSLATYEGQRRYFSRFGLAPMIFEVSQDAHPAPEKISRCVARSPRLLSLYVLRRISRMFSHMVSSTAGNRYFYVGRKIE